MTTLRIRKLLTFIDPMCGASAQGPHRAVALAVIDNPCSTRRRGDLASRRPVEIVQTSYRKSVQPQITLVIRTQTKD